MAAIKTVDITGDADVGAVRSDFLLKQGEFLVRFLTLSFVIFLLLSGYSQEKIM